jgi:hypothetical protein
MKSAQNQALAFVPTGAGAPFWQKPTERCEDFRVGLIPLG